MGRSFLFSALAVCRDSERRTEEKKLHFKLHMIETAHTKTKFLRRQRSFLTRNFLPAARIAATIFALGEEIRCIPIWAVWHLGFYFHRSREPRERERERRQRENTIYLPLAIAILIHKQTELGLDSRLNQTTKSIIRPTEFVVNAQFSLSLIRLCLS